MVQKKCFDNKHLFFLFLFLVGLGFIFKDKLIQNDSCDCQSN